MFGDSAVRANSALSSQATLSIVNNHQQNVALNGAANRLMFVTPRFGLHSVPRVDHNTHIIKQPVVGPNVERLLKHDVITHWERGGSSTALNGRSFDWDGFFSLDKMGFPNGGKKPANRSDVRFTDVAGVDEAISQLEEIVDYLKKPDSFSSMGAKLPKGVLMVGPPGTGKTLLAKAVAGEANVPYFYMSGSEFVELFVGRGAQRVRELFNKAKREEGPCIIIIDEIDAVGRARTEGFDGGSNEQAQTLNQLLVEMDGFNTDTNITVIAATNRMDVLDEALIRPGRFDRQVIVGLPDLQGRENILRVHARDKKVANDFDFNAVAIRTLGFSGADLARLMNESAIAAVRRGLPEITTDLVNETIDDIIAGPKKINYYMSPQRKELVAYHEAGHALVASMFSDFDDVQKVSIVPRGNALGLTWFTPSQKETDAGLYTFAYLKKNIATALGGRVAEEIVYGKEGVTTGASNDLQKVTAIARQIIKVFAMGDEAIPMNLDSHTESSCAKSYSEDTAKRIDDQVEKLVQDAYKSASDILKSNPDLLKAIADKLVEQEVIDGPELREMIKNFKK